jgi:hypothetical protein
MKRFYYLAFIFIFLFSQISPIFAGKVLLVDDFEYDPHPREWWQFGNLFIYEANNSIYDIPFTGKKSKGFSGVTNHWFVGGYGTYLNISATKYKFLKMIVHGVGEDSGAIQIELYDDDNFNKTIELNPNDPSLPAVDDVFTYTLKVNWKGWKVKIIPLSAFRDNNPGVGDGIFNPVRYRGSGGLTQMQLIFLSAHQKGGVDIQIDAIKFYR